MNRMRRPLRRVAVAFTTVLLATAVAAPASAAGEKAIWGDISLPNGTSAFPTYQDLGVDVFQYQLSWKKAAPTKPALATNPADPAYVWPSGVRRAIEGATAHDMTVALLVKETPGWANADAGVAKAPTSTQDYADFLTAARRKYPAVDRWMIWGEPNRAAVWDSGPVRYADLVDSAYGALKAPDVVDLGNNIVVAGMTFTFGETAPAHWIDQLRRTNGARPRFDEYGHNPFARRCPDLAQGPDYLRDGARDISDIDTLREDIRDAFGTYKPLWLSEFAVPSDRANWAFNWFVSREDQADWLARAFRIAGAVPGVSGLGWFNLVDQNTPDGLTFGLLDTALAPKLAYQAYKNASLANLGAPGSCSVTVPPATTPPVAADPNPPTVVADTRPPTISLAVPRRMTMAKLVKSFAFAVSSDEAGKADAQVSIDAATARRAGLGRTSRRFVLVRASKSIRAGRTKVSARIPAALRKKLKRSLKAKLSLRVRVTDRAGNRSTKAAVVSLRG